MNVAIALIFSIPVLLLPCTAAAQSAETGLSTAAAARAASPQQQPPNVPPAVRQVEEDIEEVVRRFRVGVQGGAGVDPELIMLGAHAAFGPLFHRSVEVRPGLEIGLGELTTLLGINFDVLYTLPGATRQTRWTPYIGAGPTFGLSHQSFETDDVDNVDTDGPVTTRNRFDFSDTDVNGGMNFIAGARNRNGLFFELKATAWGVSNIRLLGGFNF